MLSVTHRHNLSVMMPRPIPSYTGETQELRCSKIVRGRSGLADHLSISRASAIRVSSATDLAPNFRMTPPRCIFTVTSLIESSFAICLFMSPDATSFITCRLIPYRLGEEIDGAQLHSPYGISDDPVQIGSKTTEIRRRISAQISPKLANPKKQTDANSCSL